MTPPPCPRYRWVPLLVIVPFQLLMAVMMLLSADWPGAVTYGLYAVAFLFATGTIRDAWAHGWVTGWLDQHSQ